MPEAIYLSLTTTKPPQVPSEKYLIQNLYSPGSLTDGIRAAYHPVALPAPTSVLKPAAAGAAVGLTAAAVGMTVGIAAVMLP